MGRMELQSPYLLITSGFLAFASVNFLTRFITPRAACQTVKQKWKWRNVATSLVHSVVTGIWAPICFMQEPDMHTDLIRIFTRLQSCASERLYRVLSVRRTGHGGDQPEAQHGRVLRPPLLCRSLLRFGGGVAPVRGVRRALPHGRDQLDLPPLPSAAHHHSPAKIYIYLQDKCIVQCRYFRHIQNTPAWLDDSMVDCS